MRFSISNLPSAIGLLAPVWMSYFSFPMTWSSIAKYYAAVLTLRHLLLMKKLAGKKDLTPTLEVISVSHYVESVRWCMEHTNVEFKEQRDVGILGAFAFGRMVPRLHIGATTIADSKLILRFLYGHTGDEFYKPTERALELEKKIDRIGQHIRRWAYYHLLREKNGFHNGLKLWGLYSPGIPLHQKALLVLMYPILRMFLFAILGINKKNADKSFIIVNEILDEFDTLAQENRFLLGGEKPTFTDFQFCSLLCIAHPLYTGGALVPSTAEVASTASPQLQSGLEKLLQRPCGKFAVAFYDKYRKPAAKL